MASYLALAVKEHFRIFVAFVLKHGIRLLLFPRSFASFRREKKASGRNVRWESNEGGD
jgi:hypothetical protein